MGSDSELQKDVLSELAWEPMVHAAHIGVTAQNGIVTLSGHVPTYAEKAAAERVARRVKGVRAVVQQIEVRLPSADQRSDGEIAASALSVLRSHAGLPADQIQLKVEHGTVTLTGEVIWQYQKTMAEQDIRNIVGVRGVANSLVVTPFSRPTEVKQKIEEALRRNAEVEASHIAISATAGVVTLSGRVKTWHEREIVEQAAWSAPGVTAVRDELRVERELSGPQRRMLARSAMKPFVGADERRGLRWHHSRRVR